MPVAVHSTRRKWMKCFVSTLNTTMKASMKNTSSFGSRSNRWLKKLLEFGDVKLLGLYRMNMWDSKCMANQHCTGCFRLFLIANNRQEELSKENLSLEVIIVLSDYYNINYAITIIQKSKAQNFYSPPIFLQQNQKENCTNSVGNLISKNHFLLIQNDGEEKKKTTIECLIETISRCRIQNILECNDVARKLQNKLLTILL